MILNEKLIHQIEEDIKLCDNQSSITGSEELYKEMIARYTVMDSNFRNGLPSIKLKSRSAEGEFDYRLELRAISSKLKMILLMEEKRREKEQNPHMLKLNKFIERGEKIREEEFHAASDGFGVSYVSGPQYNQWMSEISIFNERYLKKHPLYNSIHTSYFHKDTNSQAYDNMMGYLRALVEDEEFWNDLSLTLAGNNDKDFENRKEEETLSTKKVFIVHGHDKLAETEMALFIERIGLKPIILHEQANSGKTIIEKIEANSDVQYAVVLYTPCDVGRAKEEKIEEEKDRARQNVVFEHGYLIGKLGRDKVSALVKGDVETPGDISGVVYIPMDENKAWQTQLIKEMRSIGLECDFSKLYS